MIEKPNVLVTGVGAIIGYGIVHSLKKCDEQCHVIGMDIYADAIGRLWCDEFVQGVLAESAEFEDFVCTLVQKYNIELIIPCIEEDVIALNNMRERLRALGVIPVLNSATCIDVFSSKFNTMALLKSIGLPALQTYRAGEHDVAVVQNSLGFPCLAKPDRAFARRGQVVIKDNVLLSYYLSSPDYLIQEYIHGHGVTEYTASIFGLGDGGYVNEIILRRKLGPDGATHKATSVDNVEISRQINAISLQSKPVGPTNFQFIYDPVRDLYFLLEINPRVSSSTSLRTAFGANEAKMCLQYFLKKQIPDAVNVIKGSAQRYIVDHIEYDSADS